ncbi:hypothetical protein [Chamaesiphon sp. VAR_69_metabat_338]|uniref:hypothetical protein n=1 Tax=Chamaesiphon sp. VAR_69_metabat_338 TaxID=2964704 RepID=UPI00286E836A|nr:hypothetical protein [Chamaesiphon sp. VAR_69_metabat_338]
MKPIERLDYDLMLARPYIYLHNVNVLMKLCIFNESYYLVVVADRSSETTVTSKKIVLIRCRATHGRSRSL